MHVALVSPYDPEPPSPESDKGFVGGVERVFERFSKTLQARGHEVSLICSSGDRTERCVQNGVNIVRVQRRGTLLRAPIAPLAQNIPDDADVVHVAATYPFTTPSVLARATQLRIPSVLDFHFEPSPPGMVGSAAATVYRQLGPRSYQQADVVLVRSQSYGRSAPSLRYVPESRWHIVPNGIDPERFHPQGQGQGDHILFVGRLVPYKGLPILLRAMARAKLDLPLHVVGDGPMRARLEKLGQRLHVPIRFLGHVPDEDLPGLYSSARLTVLPSVNRQEAFGITLLESMACGTPVVASDLPGVAELAGEGGLVARPGDVDALAHALEEATTSRLIRGKALAAHIHRNYSWDAATDRLLEAYREVA